MAGSNTSIRVVPVGVDVAVDNNGNVTITCTPNEAVVNEAHSLITYTLNTSGWRFRTSQAIQLDESHSDFPFNSWTITETQATLYDVNNDNADFDYTVTVVNTTTGQEHSIDPIIQNGGVSAGKGGD